MKSVIFIIVITIVMFAIFMYATSPKVWYAGMHDSKCEMNGSCKCFERLTVEL